ncbi:metallophosphoesterase family protein [uncultured Bacteroides sp.]|uniref:metallophosphoesterase family protein n=1 Tax=uncultured Bacteroides sp. TaxID=162156 RepID=UPI002AAB3E6D|nr:metallophosphoesterase family protein [uncultured Bacteroides sp.]
MRTKFFILFLAVAAFAIAANPPVLKFKNGNFKIVQFTDVHWNTAAKSKLKNDSTLMVIRAVLDAEKPDMVIFTGDVVVSKGVLKGWDDLLVPIEERKIPFAVTFGNHDTETDLPKEKILEYLMKNPYNLTTDAGRGIDGVGNCVLPIFDSKGKKDLWNLYLFDSNAYTNDSTLGYYDWVKKSQINWYVDQSNKIKEREDRVVPALAFFHIPVPEYEYVRLQKSTPGNKTEQVCSPAVNSGLFFAFMKQKDVKATFVGHDHNNDFVGTLGGIKLCYGRKTGFNSYGSLERGGRVIELKPDGEMTTHVRTMSGVYLP